MKTNPSNFNRRLTQMTQMKVLMLILRDSEKTTWPKGRTSAIRAFCIYPRLILFQTKSPSSYDNEGPRREGKFSASGLTYYCH